MANSHFSGKKSGLKAGFKFAEAAFEFPLLPGLFAGLEKGRARCRRFRRARRIVARRRPRDARKHPARATGSLREGNRVRGRCGPFVSGRRNSARRFPRRARIHASDRCARRLRRRSRAQRARGICGRSGKGWSLPATPRITSLLVRLISTITCFAAISFSNSYGTIFVHHVHAVADAFRVRLFDREADVAAEAVGRHESFGKFAGVQADVHLRIEAVQKADDFHVQRVIGHRNRAVLGHDVVDAHEAADRPRQSQIPAASARIPAPSEIRAGLDRDTGIVILQAGDSCGSPQCSILRREASASSRAALAAAISSCNPRARSSERSWLRSSRHPISLAIRPRG